MSTLLTGHFNVIKQIQYVEETIFGTTPSSPVFIWPGPIQDMTINAESTVIHYRQIGNRDIYRAIKTGEVYTIDLQLNPTGIDLINRGINLPNGTGTIEKSITILYSEKINGVENYIIFTGARCDEIEVEVTSEGAVDASMTFLCRGMTTPSTAHGLATPTFATPTNPTVWTNISAGANPFTYNAGAIDVSRFRFSVTNNLQVVKPNGELSAKYIEPTNRDVEVEFDGWLVDTTKFADVKAIIARAGTYKLSGASDTPANVTATFTDIYLEQYETGLSPTANETQMESYSGVAKSVAVA